MLSTAFWLTNHFTTTYLGPTAPVEDRFLGAYMSRSWASFIATGDPNNANSKHKFIPMAGSFICESVPSKITWPKYSDGQENMVWQTQGSITEKDVSSTMPAIENLVLTTDTELPPGGDAVHN